MDFWPQRYHLKENRARRWPGEYLLCETFYLFLLYNSLSGSSGDKGTVNLQLAIVLFGRFFELSDFEKA